LGGWAVDLGCDCSTAANWRWELRMYQLKGLNEIEGFICIYQLNLSILKLQATDFETNSQGNISNP
jgi:hypothetical protein